MTSFPTLPPSGSPPAQIRSSGGRGTQKAQTSRDAITDKAAETLENTKKAEEEAATSLNHMRDAFERQYTVQQAYEQSALEEQKDKGNHTIAEVEKKQRSELNRVKQDGERELSRLRDYYRSQISGLERRNRDQLVGVQSQAQQVEQSERKKHEITLDGLMTGNKERTERISTENDRVFEELKNTRTQTYENLQKEYEASFTRVEGELKRQLESIRAEHGQAIDEMKEQSHSTLEGLQKEAMLTISNYQSKLEDPFYKPIDFEAEFKDNEIEFVLTARIPEYEQKHISATVSGNQLILTGYRQTKQDRKSEEGGSQSTAAFQSFHKSFPLNWPVEAKKLTREFKGDLLIIKLPKHIV